MKHEYITIFKQRLEEKMRDTLDKENFKVFIRMQAFNKELLEANQKKIKKKSSILFGVKSEFENF